MKMWLVYYVMPVSGRRRYVKVLGQRPGNLRFTSAREEALRLDKMEAEVALSRLPKTPPGMGMCEQE
jgi:hypothetical protein